MKRKEEEYRLRFTVPPDQAGRTLLEFLAARFPYFAPDGWIDRIERRRLLVNDAPARPDGTLATGQLIEYLDPDIPEPDVNTDYTVLRDDGALLVVDKPAGLPCHPGGRYRFNCLTALVARDRTDATPMLVNRLDRETSGLVVLAVDRRAGGRLQRQFAARTVEKTYEALVEGIFPAACRAEGYIVPDTASVVRKRRLFIPAGAPAAREPPAGADHAVTRFEARGTDGTISRVTARPETGRLHQIRATLLALGYPVVGDKLYGADAAIFLRFCNNTLTDADRRAMRIERQALHAAGLAFTHPLTRQRLAFASPLPPDLATLASACRPAPDPRPDVPSL